MTGVDWVGLGATYAPSGNACTLRHSAPRTPHSDASHPEPHAPCRAIAASDGGRASFRFNCQRPCHAAIRQHAALFLLTAHRLRLTVPMAVRKHLGPPPRQACRGSLSLGHPPPTNAINIITSLSPVKSRMANRATDERGDRNRDEPIDAARRSFLLLQGEREG